MQSASHTTPEIIDVDNSQDGYAEFQTLIAERVAKLRGPLFFVNAPKEGSFYDHFLKALPASNRKHYTCRACRRFVDAYGGLVTISDDGDRTPVLWSPVGVPPFFRKAVGVLAALVAAAQVEGVFYSPDKTWGLPENVNPITRQRWTHLHGHRPAAERFKDPLNLAHQATALKTEEFAMLMRGLAEYAPQAVKQALVILKSETFQGAEVAIGIGEWFQGVQQQVAGAKAQHRKRAIVWKAVATVPNAGWCHMKNTMIATLLDDIVARVPIADAKRRWEAKVDPTLYQRPTALKEGAIDQAEKAFEKLEASSALARRFARFNEIQTIWQPRPLAAPKAAGGTFGKLRRPEPTEEPVKLPSQTMTLEKFRAKVLPTARAMQLHLDRMMMPFFGLVTAVDPDAVPILQWDGLKGQDRNPVSWYVWNENRRPGSPPHQWGLGYRTRVAVKGIILPPYKWQVGDDFTHLPDFVGFVLDGATETRNEGSCLFPQILKSEYHNFRSVIERYSNSTSLEGMEEGDANGVLFQKSANESEALTLRVWTADAVSDVIIDRWD